ncbi:MAG: chromate transporter [Cypionkella sp.]|uniref:chromate efflux transporter n=1 Tax=Cypionkella sp. TaxID=2811411 RepID=UPI0026278364|nr:chromate efflux transporter [Cypionkella sp.]MDB5660416.1 chromate transporter [Cypionkella sp.]
MTTIPELTRAFARIGILSFGGPAAQIALMHRELVDEKQWVSEDEYLSALSFCMMLPGPEAMQLATWIGWRKHGTIGGLIAGGLFVLPGALIVLALSMIYAAWGTIPLVAALFTGVQAAVLAVVIEALIRVSKRALKSRTQWVIAALAFTALFFFAAPFPAVILAAGLWGFFTAKPDQSTATTPAPWLQSIRAAAIWGAVWLIPLALTLLFAPPILGQIALFFSKLSLLTFGGAYAVLTWMAQDVVQQKQWLTLPQMIDGLGLAETTPGPLILVTEFVGYLAAIKHGLLIGLAGAILTLWMTFAPCFLWIFAGAPWIARLTHAPRLSQALKAITAAVVGVIANLSLWFAAHVIFATVTPLALGPLHLIAPDPTSLKLLPTALALLAAQLLLRHHWPLPLVLALCAITSAAVAAL